MLRRLLAVMYSRRSALTVGASFSLVVLGLFLALNRPVAEVRIEGALRDDERLQVQTKLRRLLQSARPAKVLTVDLPAVAAAVRKLGWAQAVTVRRRWPDTLIVSVQRQLLVARWHGDKALTSTGLVVSEVAVDPALPLLRAEKTAPATALTILQRLSARTPPGLRITALTERSGAGWEVVLESGDQVVLGRAEPEQLARRLQRFLLVRAAHSSAQRLNGDARYSHGVAVRAVDEPPEATRALAFAGRDF